MRSLGVLCLAASLSGCFFLWDPDSGDDTPPEGPQPAVVIAVGASVRPILESYSCDYPRFNHLCIDGNPMDITAVTVDSDAFEVGLPEEPDYDLVLPIKALRAGDAILRFELSNIIRTESVEVLIRAAEIERVDLAVSCMDTRSTAEPLGVARDVDLRFEAIAMDGEQQLLSGDLELVQAEGFTLSPPGDEGRTAKATSNIGTYTWHMTGETTATFVVYDHADLVPVLTQHPVNHEIQVEGRIDNTVRVCQHGRIERAMVEVKSGTCRPATAYAEVVGPMPISFGSGPFPYFGIGTIPFSLATDVTQSCTLGVQIESTGRASEATFDAEPEVVTLPTGTPIGATPILLGSPDAMGEDCGGSLTDGDCDGNLEYPPVPTDGDCYIDSDWEWHHVEGGENSVAVGDNDYVGVGLRTQLRLKVVAKILGLIPFDVGPPQNLQLGYATDELQIDRRGCEGLEEIVSITALESASILGHSLSLAASNLDDTEDFRIRARTVNRVEFGGRSGDVYFWESSLASITPAYFDSSIQLRGKGAVTVESAGTTAVLTNGSVSAAAGESVTIKSLAPGTGGTQRVTFVDASSVGTIVDFAFNEIGDLGSNLCTQPKPSVGGTTGIYGKGPKPKLSLSGSAFAMGTGLQGQLCLYGYAEGASNITLTWGTHSETRNWRVRDPFGI